MTGSIQGSVTIDVLAVTTGTSKGTLLDAAHRAGLVGNRTDLPLRVSDVAAIQRELADGARANGGDLS